MVAVPVSAAQLPHVSEAPISGVNGNADKVTRDARGEDTARLRRLRHSVRSRTRDVVTENATERAQKMWMMKRNEVRRSIVKMYFSVGGEQYPAYL
jgi:hypothetical protein